MCDISAFTTVRVVKSAGVLGRLPSSRCRDTLGHSPTFLYSGCVVIVQRVVTTAVYTRPPAPSVSRAASLPWACSRPPTALCTTAHVLARPLSNAAARIATTLRTPMLLQHRVPRSPQLSMLARLAPSSPCPLIQSLHAVPLGSGLRRKHCLPPRGLDCHWNVSLLRHFGFTVCMTPSDSTPVARPLPVSAAIPSRPITLGSGPQLHPYPLPHHTSRLRAPAQRCTRRTPSRRCPSWPPTARCVN